VPKEGKKGKIGSHGKLGEITFISQQVYETLIHNT
jgi:hypothetical protein